MAIAFRASAEAHVTSGDLTITVPGTVQAGDAMLLVGGLNDAGVSDFDWSPPPGWTQLRASRSGSNLFGALYGKVATSGDIGTPVTLESNSTGKSGAVLCAWSGTDPVSPFNAHAMAVETVTTVNHATPTAEATVENAVIAIAAVQSNSAAESWGTASGYTKRQDSLDNDNLNGHVTVTLQDKTVTELGTYGGETLVAANPSGKAVMFTVVLAPASDVQTSRPVADELVDGVVGVPTPGAGSGVYARLAANTDAQYAEFADDGEIELHMAPVADPNSASAHTIRFRARYAAGATGGTITTTLKEGDTPIAQWVDNLGPDFADYTHTLSSGEANSITDYTALDVHQTVDLS